MAVPFEITESPAGGKVATNGAVLLSLPDADGRVFRRRAVKNAGTADAQQVEWAVAELDGVRVYVDGQNVVVTRADLSP